MSKMIEFEIAYELQNMFEHFKLLDRATLIIIRDFINEILSQRGD
jgi:hypothetical protein